VLLFRVRVCPGNVGSCRFRGGVKGVELAVEDSGDVALEGSTDYAVATAFLSAFNDIVPRSGVVDHPGHRNGVQGTIEAPITTPIEPVPDGVTA
jgi:hypothetical protein